MLGRALVAAVVAVGLIAAAPAAATTPPRLTGESFHEDLPTITSLKCLEHIEWSSTGTATGPYPGTYFESGSIGSDPSHVTGFEASFVIYSPVGIVKGTKTGETGWGCAGDTECNSAEECDDEGASFNTVPQDDRDVYEATITIPGGGTFSDTGLFEAVFYHSEDHDSPFDGFDESFRSGLETVEFTGPKTLEACRNGGYSGFGFPDQASCKQFARARAREACTFEKVAHGTAAFRAKYGQPAMFNCVHARIGF